MIAGRFDDRGQPILPTRLAIPRFDISRQVNFLVDTGANHTCLHPNDGRHLQTPFDELREPDFAIGIGGSQQYYQEPAVVILSDSDGDGERRFHITLSIAKPQPPTPSNPRPVVNRLPSLLGRDVLNRLRIDYDYPAGRLHFYP